MDDKHWALFSASGKAFTMNTKALGALVTDANSWHSFLVMMLDGTPARMTVAGDDGQTEVLIVVRKSRTKDGSTFQDPYGEHAKPLR